MEGIPSILSRIYRLISVRAEGELGWELPTMQNTYIPKVQPLLAMRRSAQINKPKSSPTTRDTRGTRPCSQRTSRFTRQGLSTLRDRTQLRDSDHLASLRTHY